MNFWSLSLALTIALALAVPGTNGIDPAAVYDQTLSAKKKPAPPAPEPAHIACTVSGCQPTPPGCRPEMGRTWDGTPTGFDVVVCPLRR